MSVALDILRTYRSPRTVISQRIGAVEREDRALAILMAACVLIFVSTWPGAAREAYFGENTDINLLLAASLFTWLLVAPLLFYVVALIATLFMKLINRATSGYSVRMATFWSLLATTPMFLLSGLTNGFIGPSFTTELVGAIALAVFVFFWLTGLSVATKPSGDPVV